MIVSLGFGFMLCGSSLPDDPPASDDASVPTYDPQDEPEPDWETNIDCWTGVL